MKDLLKLVRKRFVSTEICPQIFGDRYLWGTSVSYTMSQALELHLEGLALPNSLPKLEEDEREWEKRYRDETK